MKFPNTLDKAVDRAAADAAASPAAGARRASVAGLRLLRPVQDFEQRGDMFRAYGGEAAARP